MAGCPLGRKAGLITGGACGWRLGVTVRLVRRVRNAREAQALSLRRPIVPPIVLAEKGVIGGVLHMLK